METGTRHLKQSFGFFFLLNLLVGLPVWAGQGAQGPDVLSSRMPVKEVTVFKDGHAFVLHQGKMPVDEQGDVFIDRLPTPIIGTFQAYCVEADARLQSVVSGRHIVSLKKTALSIRSLIEANIGAKVHITENNSTMRYQATILSIPTQSTEELRRIDFTDQPDQPSRKGDIVLLETEEGTRVVAMGRIQDITFLDEPVMDVVDEQVCDSMTLQLDWGTGARQPKAEVGMTYVQRGIRWIPGYHVDIDGQGRAKIKLQATLVNELADLDDVTAHLVVGVPEFAFKETPDPVSLQQTMARLSSVMRPDSQTAYSLSNSLGSQMARPVSRNQTSAGSQTTIDLGPDIASSGKSEDLYVFTLEHITLKKGQRLVISIAEYELEYQDIYVVDLPFAPPPEARRSFNSRQQEELARLFNAPKAVHKIRLTNAADCPLTTAPALILKQGKVMAQGLMTYTPIGSVCDLDLTTAVDVSVTNLDTETERLNNAIKLSGYNYTRVDYNGVIDITNHRSDTVVIEVVRSILGQIGDADAEGQIERLAGNNNWTNQYGMPFWWDWFSKPSWWYHLNGFARATWTCTLESGQSTELTYQWHYFWRQ